MQGIYFGLAIVGVLIIIRWFLANDHLKGDDATTGLLAMRMPSKKEQKKAEIRRKRREPAKKRTFPASDREG